MNRRLPAIAGAIALAMVPAIALASAPQSASPARSSYDRVTSVHGSHSFTTKDAKVKVVDGAKNNHHATIDTRLYVPDNASRRHRQPAILMTHGFGLSKTSDEVTATAKFLARHGYIVLTWTGQGFGKSSGCIRLDSFDYDVKDAKQLVKKVLVPRKDVLRDRHGLVLGMTGGSYGGGITLNTAAMDHRIRAIVPGRTWNALQYSLDPNNYVFRGGDSSFDHTLGKQGVFKLEWTSLFFAAGNGTPVGGIPPSGDPQGGCIQEKAASGDPTTVAGVECLGYPTAVCDTYAHTASTGDARPKDKALLANSSVAFRIRKLHAATLLLQGESDTLFNANEAVATYVALKRRHVPVAMTWNYGGHGGYNSKPGECDVYGGGDSHLDRCYLTIRTLRWFDHYLRGKPLGHFPHFTYYRPWVRYAGHGPNDEQYGVARRYPLAHAIRFHLSGFDRLVRLHKPVTKATATFLNPPGGDPAAYSETSNFSGPGSTPNLAEDPSDVPGQFASYTSGAFRHAVVSAGVPTAKLHLSHTNGRDLVFFAKIFDVAKDGSATLINRLAAPVRVPAARVDRTVRIKLLGFAHRFKKGHRVRLVLASTDAAYYNARVADVITTRSGGRHPASFRLPVAR